ncbi:hypothetical protein [Ligilactobacillus animalis]|jgi:DNA-directed RNA polymerase specialized sigma subunit|uniref:hypothetical protein n=1 Tax=Ligilactobacillus animalis TaxID=1605 RepID=UPI00259A75AA|nr:hypothetical protein [Ligilactobacillus animalis]
MDSKKIIAKHKERLDKALEKNDWDTVLKILDTPYQNKLRKDRKYNLQSLNTTINSSDGKAVEVIEITKADINHFDPLDILLTNERNNVLADALLSLKDIDRKIVIEYCINQESFLSISNMVNLSDKTVKAHYLSSITLLKNYLKNYFHDFFENTPKN